MHPTETPVPPGDTPSHPPEQRPDGQRREDRSGAIWVAAAGALLLFAAAATFVAVRWDQFADWQKFAALVAVTQLLLIAGWLGRRRVPATAASVFSLGAVLVPLDAWTIAAGNGGSWKEGLLVGAAVALVSTTIARRLLDTVALRWSQVIAVPLTLAGLSAVAGPAPLALGVALLGLGALALGYRRSAVCWLGLAALAPLAVMAGPVLPLGRGVLADLGLIGPWTAWSTAATALVLVAASLTEARRGGRAELVAAGAALALADLVLALVDAGATTTGWSVAAAGVFLTVQLAATVTSQDAFWATRTDGVAVVALWLSPIGLLGLVAQTLEGALPGSTGALSADPAGLSLAAALFAIGWLMSDDRLGRSAGRAPGLAHLLASDDSAPATWAVTSFGVVAVMSLPISAAVAMAGSVALGATILLTRRSGGALAGAGAVLAGLLPLQVLVGSAALGPAELAIAVSGVLVLSIGSRRDPDDTASALLALSAAASLTWWTAALAFGPDGANATTLSSQTVLGGGLLVALAAGAVVSDRRDALPTAIMWVVATMAVLSLFDTSVDPAATLLAAAACTTCFAVQAMLGRDRLLGVFAVVISPTIAVAVLRATSLDAAQVGLTLAVVAAAVAAASLLVASPARRFLQVSAAAHILVGVGFSLDDPATFGAVVMIGGLLLLAVAIAEGRIALAVNGAGLALLGSWQMLDAMRVTTPEAYLAPLALVMTIAGAHARLQRNVSSWVAFVPGLALLGGASLALRMTGGAGWHGLVAGGVAVLAIAVGAWWRLAGPLLVGSLLLAAVTVNETVRVSAGVPTWIWLALGGATLLGAGVAMELRGLSPVESGRRVVEVVGERFD